MIQNNGFSRAVKTLEFDKILEQAVHFAPTKGSAELVRTLYPTNDIAKVRQLQKETTDAVALYFSKGMPSFGGVTDIIMITERADKGAALSPRDLLDVANLLKTCRYLDDYIKTDKKFDTVLDEIFARIQPNKFLEEKISRAIISEDVIADEASATLSDIRRKIKQTNSKIRDSLQKYISSGTFTKYLQENIVTQRNGRYVVPVKSEYKNEVKGMVHDTSSSGATFFIEPAAVVEANNELKILQNKEEDEIERILFELSSNVAAYSEVLRLDYYNVTYLAAVFTRAKLSSSYNGVEPEFNDKKYVKLIKARHPLLNKDSVVPIDITLGGDYSVLVITGPNTGGKTVTLKTLGLFAMMAQSGLHIPVNEGSTVCLFDSILADIGDEQSIEQSLSTFSAHMTNTVNIMKQKTENSLVLFDELGAGTDPVEGAALAMSILEEVRKTGALCSATTHYAELKAYAVETDGVCNGSCEFNVETLKPTYKLIIGTPGRSNAFAIVEKLGLSSDIINRAKHSVNQENKRFEDVISRLENERAEMERIKLEAAQEKAEFEKYKAQSEKELEKRLSAAEKELENARVQARGMVDSARASSEFIFDQLNKLQKERDKANLGESLKRSRAAVRDNLRANEDKFDVVQDETDSGYELPRDLVIGDEVILSNIKKQGTVKSLPDKNGNLTVDIGVMTTKTNIKNIRLLGTPGITVTKDKKKFSEGEYRSAVRADFKPEIDVRGQVGEDAWFMVDKFIDEAIMAHFKTITVIHGKGTGALRAALQRYFKTDKRISSFRNGVWGEGDMGVTVLELK